MSTDRHYDGLDHMRRELLDRLPAGSTLTMTRPALHVVRVVIDRTDTRERPTT